MSAKATHKNFLLKGRRKKIRIYKGSRSRKKIWNPWYRP